jgi:putative addiction module component (TIGR02574 family)
MAHITPEVSEVLGKALSLSSEDRGLVIDRLIASLDEGAAEEGVGEAWAEEVKRRVDDIRAGKVEMIPGEEIRRRLAARLLHAEESGYSMLR